MLDCGVTELVEFVASFLYLCSLQVTCFLNGLCLLIDLFFFPIGCFRWKSPQLRRK